MLRTFSVRPTEPPGGTRADMALAHAAGISRSRAKAFVLEGRVALDGRPLDAPDATVRAGASFAVDWPEEPAPTDLAAQDIPFGILYEDADILVIDKPAGLVVHPAAGHADGTLVNAILHHCGPSLRGIGGERRPGIVHRLDRFTSGAMVVAKTQAALDGLAAQFKGISVHKRYLALVHGVPEPPFGHVENEIGRHPTDRKRMAVVTRGGRLAITDYATARVFPESGAALLEVAIATGRTHQIRVHMRHIGHPVVGDPLYGSAALDRDLGVEPGRHFLHARLLSLRHPATGEDMTFSAPVPADMAALLERLS